MRSSGHRCLDLPIVSPAASALSRRFGLGQRQGRLGRQGHLAKDAAKIIESEGRQEVRWGRSGRRVLGCLGCSSKQMAKLPGTRAAETTCAPRSGCGLRRVVTTHDVREPRVQRGRQRPCLFQHTPCGFSAGRPSSASPGVGPMGGLRLTGRRDAPDCRRRSGIEPLRGQNSASSVPSWWSAEGRCEESQGMGIPRRRQRSSAAAWMLRPWTAAHKPSCVPAEWHLKQR